MSAKIEARPCGHQLGIRGASGLAQPLELLHSEGALGFSFGNYTQSAGRLRINVNSFGLISISLFKPPDRSLAPCRDRFESDRQEPNATNYTG